MGSKIIFILLVTVALAASQNPWMQGTVTVDSKVGNITGFIQNTTVYGKDAPVKCFLGIPYAEPPTGDRRFARPVVKAPFNTEYDGTRYRSVCIQNMLFLQQMIPGSNFTQSEDCLFLNIYAPVGAAADNQKAVMIWIHGGGWAMGAGQLNDGSFIASYGDVVVVTINYRLGPFGYLSTEDSNAPGNAALFDQLLAIKWVKANIAEFGGDPDTMTVFGESAGGFDTSFQCISPLSAGVGLFKRCIPQSGSGVFTMPNHFPYSRMPLKSAKMLATSVGCTTPNTADLIRCLRSKSYQEIYAATERIASSGANFQPSVDGFFLPQSPVDLVANPNMASYENFKNVDLMIGSNSADGDIGTLIFSPLFAQGIPRNFTITKEQLATMFNFWARRSSDVIPNTDDVSHALAYEYIPPTDVTLLDNRDAFVDMLSDSMFIQPSIATARSHEEMEVQAKTYMYYLTYTNNAVARSALRRNGAKHGADINYLFVAPGEDNYKIIGQTLFPIGPTDRKLSQAIITYWTNFAKYGNPNGNMSDPSTKSSLPEWPEFSLDNQQYMEFGSNSTNLLLTAKKDLRAKQSSFWLDYLPYVLKQTCPTSAPGASCPTCPPILDQYIGYLRITVAQAETVIVIFAVLTGVFGVLCLILTFACCAAKRKLKASNEKGAPSHSNAAFSSVE